MSLGERYKFKTRTSDVLEYTYEQRYDAISGMACLVFCEVLILWYLNATKFSGVIIVGLIVLGIFVVLIQQFLQVYTITITRVGETLTRTTRFWPSKLHHAIQVNLSDIISIDVQKYPGKLSNNSEIFIQTSSRGRLVVGKYFHDLLEADRLKQLIQDYLKGYMTDSTVEFAAMHPVLPPSNVTTNTRSSGDNITRSSVFRKKIGQPDTAYSPKKVAYDWYATGCMLTLLGFIAIPLMLNASFSWVICLAIGWVVTGLGLGLSLKYCILPGFNLDIERMDQEIITKIRIRKLISYVFMIMLFCAEFIMIVVNSKDINEGSPMSSIFAFLGPLSGVMLFVSLIGFVTITFSLMGWSKNSSCMARHSAI